MTNLKVAILGGGISAAYINYACLEVGIKPFVISKAKTGASAGCFWLHWIPKSLFKKGLKYERIYLSSIGTEENYVKKQWGNVRVTDESSSFPVQAEIVYGYDPAYILPFLWQDTDVASSGNISDARAYDLTLEYDIVFKTFPNTCDIKQHQKYLCTFPVVTYIDSNLLQNLVMYNGIENDELVRFSVLFRRAHYEFLHLKVIEPHQYKYGKLGTMTDIHPMSPPLMSELYASNLYLIGRYAQFKRRMLAHEAYDEATKILRKYS
ncbi:hypothetical protein LCGC14_0466400 [marine sediment metagenome]|uniref:Uncharacterized protein n=1 Tax=marine sediment metagenome TaxID=412755 RepID=A0A0F9SDM6_9ZZZZ